MPCPSFALPAGEKCLTGRKLMLIPGTVCKSCYARKGYSAFPAPQAVRLTNWKLTAEALHSKLGRHLWIRRMAALIEVTGNMWFRWHDSGDLLSAQHLHMICEVCELTPKVQHWLPTREYKFVRMVSHSRPIPANLTIRLSAHKIGDVLTADMPTSSVDAKIGFSCPATHKESGYDKKCLTCRACWDKEVSNIDYGKH